MIRKKDLTQTHLCIGFKGLPRNHRDRYALGLLNSMLGGSVSSRDNQGNTPLHVAVAARKKGIAELLLTHGADVNATIPSGSTALDIANTQGDTALADFLTQHGARSGTPDGTGT